VGETDAGGTAARQSLVGAAIGVPGARVDTGARADDGGAGAKADDDAPAVGPGDGMGPFGVACDPDPFVGAVADRAGWPSTADGSRLSLPHARQIGDQPVMVVPQLGHRPGGARMMRAAATGPRIAPNAVHNVVDRRCRSA
jgi:hypothetical protein